ncbi:MAG: hypothetical protein ACI89L_001519 [Phycisphaerales bacterium]|jgi:hypothetical protein
MFDLSPAVLISGLLIGTLGMAMFIWGKKQEDFLALGVGLALSIIPLLISSAIMLWLATVGIIGGMWAIRRYG